MDNNIILRDHKYTYNAHKIIGSGSFGTVYQAIIAETGETVAIKKVFQDKKYKNREYQILQMIDNQNVIKLKQAFFTEGDRKEGIYLNVVMDYIPDTLSKIIKCHRDIKPQNILIDPCTHSLKICDFGSAKKILEGELNISYICSRHYRAPELIFGCTDYKFAIDIWSAGCVIAEMVLGRPIFLGESSSDQILQIIKVLGVPSKAQILEMNSNYNDFKFPNIKSISWSRVFKNRIADDTFFEFLSMLLVYEPEKRLNPLKALLHPFFDELRLSDTKLVNNIPLLNLFNFSENERKSHPETVDKLVPDWYRNK